MDRMKTILWSRGVHEAHLVKDLLLDYGVIKDRSEIVYCIMGQECGWIFYDAEVAIMAKLAAGEHITLTEHFKDTTNENCS